MLHFNELTATEDGKHLVIDVEIDNLPIYKKCYIDTITVNTAERHCNGDSSNPVEVYQSGTGLTYVDMDNDGVISEQDRAKVEMLDLLFSRSKYSQEELAKYDFNNNGVIDLNDLAMLIQAILDSGYSDSRMDVNNDGEITLADINAFINVMISLYPDDDPCGDRGMFKELLETYTEAYNYTDAAGNPLRHTESSPKQHVRLCLCISDLQKLDVSSLDGHVFIVKVTAKTPSGKVDPDFINAIACLSCGYDIKTLTGAAYNSYPLYRRFLDIASQYSGDCSSSIDALADYALQYFGFDFAIRTGDWCLAQSYMKRLLGSGMSSVSFSRGCGCHGTY